MGFNSSGFLSFLPLFIMWSVTMAQKPSFNQSFEVPESIDWREQSAVNEVQDQSKDAPCGSCYAFATIAALESHYFIKTGKLLKLSEQEIVDCAEGTDGCIGGSPAMVYNYIIKNGIALAEDYPYTSKQGKCRKDEVARSEVTVYGYSVLESSENLTNAVAEFGPLAIEIHAHAKHVKFYANGIHNNLQVFKLPKNHGVVLVGYGTDKKTGMDYWIVRNSWSEDWGENGYIRILRTNNTDSGYSYFPLLNEAVKDKNKEVYPAVTLSCIIVGFLLMIICCCFICRSFYKKCR
jgi:C1A family cysteine protease